MLQVLETKLMKEDAYRLERFGRVGGPSSVISCSSIQGITFCQPFESDSSFQMLIVQEKDYLVSIMNGTGDETCLFLDVLPKEMVRR
jgi:hypothetical protein